MIQVIINGQTRKINEGLSLKALLESHQINPNSVVVEHNEAVIPRVNLDLTRVGSGDKIEIVHFVGGGSGDEPAAEHPETPKVKPKPKKRPKKKETETVIPLNGPKNLVIVESPSKAKTINKYLGNDYLVEASLGHVRDLPKSRMGIEIQNNFSPEYIISMKSRKTVKHLKAMAKGKSHIYLAPDPDREGEAISWHLAHIFSEADGNVPIRRVVFNEITKEAVKEAFQHPRDIMMNLVNAQQARRILDRIVGYELSPLLWRKVGRGLSAGRVQSVALRLIVEREKEVKSFVPVEYWSMEAKLFSENIENAGKFFIAKLDRIGKEKADIKTREEAEALRGQIQGLPFKVAKVEKKERPRRAQAPYTTSKLQQESYNRLGFPAAKTMKIAQKLYEGIELGGEGTVGLITYMRTDSVNVSQTALREVRQYIAEKFGETYLTKEPNFYKSKKGAQEAHEAVRPTSVLREPKAVEAFLSPDENKLYDLIWKKFVASQMPPALDEYISVSIVAGEDYFFKTTGKRNLFPGFTIVFEVIQKNKQESGQGAEEEEGDDDALSESELPHLTEGELLKLLELLGNQHFTKPPARFNDASLVKTLEELGIGRPSTYAPTIFTLLSREYVNRKSGALVPTELGETVADLLIEHFPKIMDVQFTAGMEENLDRVEEGEVDWVNVLKDFYPPFEQNVLDAREKMKNIKAEVVPTEYKCDICGKTMVIRFGRFGRFLACEGFPDCKYTRSIPTGFRCPQPDCGGDLVKRMSKKRRTFYGCSNYPKCNYIANKLPKAAGEGESISEDEKLDEGEAQTP